MKTKYFLTAMVLLGAAACAKLDYHEISEDNSNIMNLVVKGMLATDTDKTYDSIIDDEAKVVTVQVPYYLSDTEQIQGDLTRMRLRATLPQGAVFKPLLLVFTTLSKGSAPHSSMPAASQRSTSSRRPMSNPRRATSSRSGPPTPRLR